MKKRGRALDSFLVTCTSIVVLCGCGNFGQTAALPAHPNRGQQHSPPNEQAPAIVRTRTCATRAAQFGEWLNVLTVESLRLPGTLHTRLGVRLVPYQGGAVRPLPIVELMNGRVSVEGRLFTRDAELPLDLAAQVVGVVSALDELAKIRAQFHPGEAALARVALAIDRDVPWRDVVTLTAGLAPAGYLGVDLLFATRSRGGLAVPQASSIDPDLADVASIVDPTRKAAKLGMLAERVFARCPEAHETFVDLGAMDWDRRLPHLHATLPAAVENCGCAIELEALETLLFGIWGVPAGATTYSAVPGRLARAGVPAPVLTLPAETPWSEAHRSIVDAAGASDGFVVRLATTAGETAAREPTVVLRLHFRKPVIENARKFLRRTGKSLDRSASSGAFYVRVGERELKELFGLEIMVTVVNGAGNATNTAARFQKLKHPQELKLGLRALLDRVELEDDPKFDLIDDAEEYHPE